jgi:long-chain acyl-CoA synthetase
LLCSLFYRAEILRGDNVISRAEAIQQLTAPGQIYELQNIDIKGKTCPWFVSGPQTLSQLFAENLSDQTFYVYGDERYSFNDVYGRASSLASRLISDFGIKPGDRVGIAMRNYPEWPIALTAIISIGAIAVAVNAWWEVDELEYGLNHTKAKVIIADQERLDRLMRSEKLGNVAIISVRSKPVPNAIQMDTLTCDDAAMPQVDIAADDNAVILFTSGSTGRPKGSVSTHRNIISSLLSWELEIMCNAMQRVTKRKPSADRSYQIATLLAMPLFHVNGLLAVLLSSYRSQRKTVAMFKWDPVVGAELIEKEKIATFVGTPAMTGDLTAEGKRTNRDLSSLLVVGGGGAARAPSQVSGIKKTFKNAAPNTGWGMTETNSIGTSIYGDEYLERPESSGRRHPVLELAIIDGSGNFLPANRRGELLVRGTSVISGYWDRPDANGESFWEDWFRTGDIAYLDDEGYLFIVDRLKQLIIRGGENIGCSEVESALLHHSEIIEASVYGIPDDRLGEEVGATVYVGHQFDAELLKSKLKSQLANFKIPRYLEISENSLPRIASGKIDKRVIRASHLKKLGIKA